MESWQGFIGAVLGGIVVGLFNLFLQNRQQKHAMELQRAQWAHEDTIREGEWSRARGERVAEWDNARTDQRREWDRRRVDLLEQRADDRKRAAEQVEMESLRELQVVLPRFSRAARYLWEDKIGRANSEAQGEEFARDEDLHLYVTEFNNLRYDVLTIISRIGNEKVRKAASILYTLDEDMALSSTAAWRDSRFYGGHDPMFLQVDRQRQLIRMVGKLLRAPFKTRLGGDRGRRCSRRG